MLMQLIGIRRFGFCGRVGTKGLAWVQIVEDMVLMELRFSVTIRMKLLELEGVGVFKKNSCIRQI